MVGLTGTDLIELRLDTIQEKIARWLRLRELDWPNLIQTASTSFSGHYTHAAFFCANRIPMFGCDSLILVESISVSIWANRVQEEVLLPPVGLPVLPGSPLPYHKTHFSTANAAEDQTWRWR
jgi:hypothetical protein